MASANTPTPSLLKPGLFLVVSLVVAAVTIVVAFHSIAPLLPSLPTTIELPNVTPPALGSMLGSPLCVVLGIALVALITTLIVLLATVFGFLLGRLSCARGCGCGGSGRPCGHDDPGKGRTDVPIKEG